MPHHDVQIETQDGICSASLSVPSGTGPWPAVLSFSDAGSLRDTTREMGERLSSLGYVVLVPDMFYRSQPYEPFDMRTVFDSKESMARMTAVVTAYSAAIAYAKAFGMPEQLLPFAIAVEVGCGVAILLGYYTRAGALLLAAFCITAAIMFHWNWSNRNELLHFEKDLAIAGGLLVLFARGAGGWALDALRKGANMWPG